MSKRQSTCIHCGAKDVPMVPATHGAPWDTNPMECQNQAQCAQRQAREEYDEGAYEPEVEAGMDSICWD